jgi:hypothetical protein
MSAVTVVAVREFTHKGRTIHAGEALECEALEAAVYAKQRCVTLDRAVRATYRTTDLTAAPPESSPAATAAPSEPAAAPPARRSRRQRRP